MSRLHNISRSIKTCLVSIGMLVLAKAGTAQTSVQEQAPITAQATKKGSAHEYLRAGDKAFQRGDFAQAELEYRRASETDPNFKSLYNLGVSLAKQDRGEEAAEQFERAKRYADAQDEVVDASYNAGNAHLQQEDLKESIKQYVDALRANPDDVEAKQNLAEGEPGEPVDVDREEAERLLKLASDQEKKTQEKVRLGEQTRQKPEKDW